jgi:phosphatidylinositol alpha-1,6-mannosyltransferase
MPELVLVVPDTVREAFTPGDGSTQRAALALEGKRVLLTVGRMDPRERYKGHDRVVAAIPELVTKGYDIHYLIIGEGDDRTRLEALARDVGVSERVRFLGRVELQTLVEIYRMADLFVMPSTGEGFGVVFLEAMASGTPALGLGVAGATDALADGELGTAASEAELPATIARLLDEPRPDPGALAAAARARFGREVFAAGACAALSRLAEQT